MKGYVLVVDDDEDARVLLSAVLMGLGVGSRDQALAATVSARPTTGGCDGLLAAFLTWDPGEIEVLLQPESSGPDEGGWCRYHAVTASRQAGTLLYLENTSESDILVDDAGIEPAVGEQAQQHAHAPVPAALREQLLTRRVELRKALAPNDPPPNQRLQNALRRLMTRRRR